MSKTEAGVRVRFWEDAYKNAAKSTEAGRDIYDTVDWCEVQVLGETDTVSGPVHKLHPDPRERFPAAWAQYQRDKSTEGLVGTPLKFVPWLGAGEVETLKASKILTLEHLAEVSDASITKFPGGLELRQKARDQIRMAKESAPAQALSADLAKANAQIASLQEQIAEMAKASARRKKAED